MTKIFCYAIKGDESSTSFTIDEFDRMYKKREIVKGYHIVRGYSSYVMKRYDFGHYWGVCPTCGPIVYCGVCGNNCCNSGHGTVNGVECTACWAAYDLQKEAYPGPYKWLDRWLGFKAFLWYRCGGVKVWRAYDHARYFLWQKRKWYHALRERQRGTS